MPDAKVFPLALHVCAALIGVLTTLVPATTPAAADPFADAVAALNADGFSAKQEAVHALAALDDPRALPVLQAMLDGALYVGADGQRLVVGREAGRRQLALADVVTGEDLGTVGSREVSRVRINNRLRTVLRSAISRLEISAPNPTARLAAARALAQQRTPETAALLRDALEREDDAGVRDAIALSLAQIELLSDDRATRLAALHRLSGTATPEVRGLLLSLVRCDDDGTCAEPDEEIRAAAAAALAEMERRLALIEVGLTVFQGISLGSVLLLAAIGLAITFGVMGVINMAHGEMIMLGAYATFTVQQLFRSLAPPEWFDFYVVAAVPAAFLVAGAVGVAMERGIIRYLYGRPLETLLATWGISLILQQVVRTFYGAPNREVANPSWMTGGFEAMGGAVFTYNRLTIIVFAVLVLAAVALVVRYTAFGLQMRAVTQNRPMAAAMGIRSGWVDAMTFGLGSGIAGVGGVALSQIGNVSPNLGQAYIVDSFMVVVFGGVGSLWGVLTAAVGLGIVNKLLEPYAGVMLGKIMVLVLIILFIQKRPQGLFALRGRAAET